jgi:DNA-binding Lrp family transcriptional regulator
MPVQAYILFKVNSGAEREVCKNLVNLNGVLEASITYGEYDIVAKVSVPELHALEDFLSEQARKVPGVILTSTMIIAQEYRGKKTART